jgi:urease accessory protein UreF
MMNLSFDQPFNGLAEPTCDPALLQECLGSPDGLGTLGLAVWSGGAQTVTDAAGLERFVQGYCASLLLPLELPAIRRAYYHTAGYQVRELLAFDQELAREPALTGFGFASQAVGRGYLRRLRPLRDVRLLRRYERAVQAGTAAGWHTLVYGAVLSVYSIPLRQGLLSYARQTLNGFIEAGASRLQLKVADQQPLRDRLLAPVSCAVHGLCAAGVRVLPNHEPWNI